MRASIKVAGNDRRGDGLKWLRAWFRPMVNRFRGESLGADAGPQEFALDAEARWVVDFRERGRKHGMHLVLFADGEGTIRLGGESHVPVPDFGAAGLFALLQLNYPHGFPESPASGGRRADRAVEVVIHRRLPDYAVRCVRGATADGSANAVARLVDLLEKIREKAGGGADSVP